MAKPSDAVSVGVVPLSLPFTSMTLFTNPKQPSELRASYKTTSWALAPVSQDLPFTESGSDGAFTTVLLWWNQPISALGWRYQANTLPPAQSTTIFEIQLFKTTATTTSGSSISHPITSAASLGITPVSTDSAASSTLTQSQAILPSSAPSTKASKDGLAAGAVAGVALGCLLAGAIVAGLIALFFLRKTRQSNVRDSETSSMALIHREKGPAVKTLSLESGSPVAGALENALPLPLEDKAISGEVSKIGNLIKNHVQSYYHTGRMSPVLIDFDDLQALGDDMPVSVGTLSTLLGNSATRETALRFCIAWIVVSRMQLQSPPSTTLLPPEISQCLHTMDLGVQGPKVHAAYFSRWRSITAELMQSVYVRNPFSTTDSRLHNLQLATNLLNNVLRPYSDPRMDDGQRCRNLEEILKRSALFAFTLFSQPSTWEFDWENGQDVKSGSLCIFPALVQVKNENGESVNPPRPFNEAVVRRLDE